MNRFLKIVFAWMVTLSPIASPLPTPLAHVTFEWDSVLDASVTEIHIYYGTQSRAYRAYVAIPANAVGYTWGDLEPGVTYFFAATTQNAVGESVYSNELVYTVPGLPRPRLSNPPLHFRGAQNAP